MHHFSAPIPAAPASGVILIVDDVPENLAVLGNILTGAGYRVRAANSGRAALRRAAQAPVPDLILLDIMMPEMDGHAVLAELRAAPASADTPVIFVTALGDPLNETRGLSEGACDYLSKPLSPPLVLARVRAQLEVRRARDLLRSQNSLLQAAIARHLGENRLMQDVSISALTHLAGIRDHETGNHLLRTQAYVRLLAQRLRDHPRFRACLDDDAIDLIAKSAPLHDIGKVGIPDQILLKRGRLTAQEWEVMKTHAQLGGDALARVEHDLGQSVPLLHFAKQIAYHHHEHWDGSGYPAGLAGEAIPVAARLMALADVFDALISARIYKAPMSLEQTCAIIDAERGRHFDPAVVDAFLADVAAFEDIARRHADPSPDPQALSAAPRH